MKNKQLNTDETLQQIVQGAIMELFEREADGALKLEVRDYVMNPEFAKNILSMPLDAAIAEVDFAMGLDEEEKTEYPRSLIAADMARYDGQRDVMEKMQSRRALPSSMRVNQTAALGRNYKTMTSQEFKRNKERMRRQSEAGQRIHL